MTKCSLRVTAVTVGNSRELSPVKELELCHGLNSFLLDTLWVLPPTELWNLKVGIEKKFNECLFFLILIS